MTNSFLGRLGGEVQLGCWLNLASANSAELLATVGYDWMLIDGEHGPNTITTIIEQMRAIEPHDPEIVVRALNHDPDGIKQLLDIGANTLMIPCVETAAQAEMLVKVTTFAPHGMRGMAHGSIRGSRWGAISDYYEKSQDGVCVIAQIESAMGVENIDRIAKTDGLKAIFVGPSDLSASMGFPMNPWHPEVLRAIEKVRKAVKAENKYVGIAGSEPTHGKKFIQDGFDFMSIGGDVKLMRDSAAMNLKMYRA